jgi:DNA-binding XRE family transcriptional regulator
MVFTTSDCTKEHRMSAATFTMDGKRFVVLPEIEYRRLRERSPGKGAAEEWGLPPLPGKLPSGNYPAVEYARALMARDLIRSRRRLGLTQSELARRAGVRVESLNRIERAKMTATPKLMEKLDAVLSGSPTRAAGKVR